MRTIALAAAVLALLSPAADAAPRPLPVPVNRCHVEITEEQGGTVSGILYGSVAVADLPEPDDAGANPVEVTLTCSLQSAGYRHDDPDDLTATASGTAVAVLEPVQFTVPEPVDEWGSVGVCARADVRDAAGGTRTYYAYSQNGTWSTSPDVECSGRGQCQAMGAQCFWPFALAVEVLEYGAGWGTPALEPLTCEALRALAPGVPGLVDIRDTGDTDVLGEPFWDCPPYDW